MTTLTASPETAPLVAGDQGVACAMKGAGVGRGHAHPGVELLPAHAELAPVFEVRVDAGRGG